MENSFPAYLTSMREAGLALSSAEADPKQQDDAIIAVDVAVSSDDVDLTLETDESYSLEVQEPLGAFVKVEIEAATW